MGLTKHTPAYVTLHKGQPARLCRVSPCRTASWGLDKDLTAIRVIGRPADQEVEQLAGIALPVREMRQSEPRSRSGLAVTRARPIGCTDDKGRPGATR